MRGWMTVEGWEAGAPTASGLPLGGIAAAVNRGIAGRRSRATLSDKSAARPRITSGHMPLQ
jgi:hypothetical protein